RAKPRLPYNVLWIAVEGLRADAATGPHDASHPRSPLPDTSLPKIAGLTPTLDALAARGVRFASAFASSTAARAATLAMLTGVRASELEGAGDPGSSASGASASPVEGSTPALVSLAVQGRGALSHAFVHGASLGALGEEQRVLGFERLVEHRHPTQDNEAIAGDVASFVREHADARFF